MSTRILTNVVCFLLATACLSDSVLGQGSFVFGNRIGGGPWAPVFDTDCQTGLGSGFLAQPYVGDTPEQLQPLEPIIPFIREGFLAYSPTVNVPGPAFRLVYVQMRAWDAAAGPSYEAAVSSGGKHGFSNIIPVEARPNLAGPLDETSEFQSFCLIPEPASWALGLIGAVGLCAALSWRGRPSTP